jgi:hypothetical protein
MLSIYSGPQIVQIACTIPALVIRGMIQTEDCNHAGVLKWPIHKKSKNLL